MSDHYPTDAMRPIIGNEYVPDTMEARGRIKYLRTDTQGKRNGLLELVPAGFPGYNWTFDNLLKTEYRWFSDLIGAFGGGSGLVDGPYAKRFYRVGSMPAFRLWNPYLNLVDYYTGVLELPTWEEYRNGRFFTVTVTISGLVPE